MNKFNYIPLICLFLILCPFLHAKGDRNNQPIKFKVKKEIKYQVIDNFGASDAWRTDFIGKYWPMEKREKIADLLFSTRVDKEGNPIGIGLSNWRVNIGAGSYENREAHDVVSTWNRTECFLSPDGSYDFTKQAGQQWFMKAARKRGVDDFLFFTNSAPYFMTRSASTLAPDMRCINLQNDKFTDFAEFLAKTAGHFINEGFNVRYISPINEPQIDWGTNKNQEGSFATNADAFRLVTELDKAISKYNLPSRIVFGEAADMKYLFDCDTNRVVPDNLIEEFFSRNGQYNIMNMKNVYNCISGHDYWSAYPAETLVGMREKISSSLSARNNGTRFWASEYCILEKNDEISGLSPAVKSINLGLYVARIIHNDLAVANASAWQWWTAVSLGEDVPIQLKPKENCKSETVKYDGIISPTKMLWTTGNFSLFIRPGMWRISIAPVNQKISDMEAATSLMSSAYTDGNKVVLVFVNYDPKEKNIGVNCDNSTEGKMYLTSIDKNLEYMGSKKLSTLTIPSRSVVTVVI
ncbi:glycoside hydrolase [Bacteroides sp.]